MRKLVIYVEEPTAGRFERSARKLSMGKCNFYFKGELQRYNLERNDGAFYKVYTFLYETKEQKQSLYNCLEEICKRTNQIPLIDESNSNIREGIPHDGSQTQN